MIYEKRDYLESFKGDLPNFDFRKNVWLITDGFGRSLPLCLPVRPGYGDIQLRAPHHPPGAPGVQDLGGAVPWMWGDEEDAGSSPEIWSEVRGSLFLPGTGFFWQAAEAVQAQEAVCREQAEEKSWKWVGS